LTFYWGGRLLVVLYLWEQNLSLYSLSIRWSSVQFHPGASSKHYIQISQTAFAAVSQLVIILAVLTFVSNQMLSQMLKFT